MNELKIREATANDVDIIYDFIKGLAIYEKLENEFIATKEDLSKTIFELKQANVLIGFEQSGTQNIETQNNEPQNTEIPVCFALYFYNYSTFLAKAGIYLEDLFVIPEKRSLGYGTKMLKHLVSLAVEKDLGRVEWSVLNWNTPAIKVYQKIGAKPQSEWTVYRLTNQSMKDFIA